MQMDEAINDYFHYLKWIDKKSYWGMSFTYEIKETEN